MSFTIRFTAVTRTFLGTDYDEFKDYSLAMVHKGYPRRNLDSMMKLNVFSSVAEAEGHSDPSNLLFYFEYFYIDGARMTQQPAREFIVSLFEEVIHSVKDNANYTSKYLFDRNVFQKFIAVMFINYATTDPMFYGINKRDYGVSADKDMDATPLYDAIRKELSDIEERYRSNGTILTSHKSLADKVTPIGPIVGRSDSPVCIPLPIPAEPESKPEPDFSTAFAFPDAELSGDTPHAGRLSFEQAATMLPAELVNSEVLIGPITSLCSTANLMQRSDDPEIQRFARVVLADASRLVRELKRLGIISEMMNDPDGPG